MKKILFAVLFGLCLFAVSSADAQTITAALSWTDNSNNEDGFGVERGSAVAGPFTQLGNVLSNVTAFSDVGLSPGLQYCYRVYAFNTIGKSGYSNVACVTTGTLPATPGNVTVVVTVTP